MGKITSPDDEALSELDLISLDEPKAVDLGDFSPVWQYISSNFKRVQSFPSQTLRETTPSRKPLFRRPPIKTSPAANVPDNLNPISDPSSISLPLNYQSKRQSLRTWSHQKGTKATQDYSSPDEDTDGESCSVSSRYHFFPRRKSFLYVPPTFSSPLLLEKTTVLPSAPSAADRRRNLILKLISQFPREVNTILLESSSPKSEYPLSFQASQLHIFVDNSNILIGFYDTYKTKHGITEPFFRLPKFDFHAFTTILERGRLASRKTLVGSNPLIQPVALAQQLGYEVSILERVVDTSKQASSVNPWSSDSATRTSPREKKKEQAVDEILHLKILECLLDIAKPSTIVLATGDAAPAEFSPDGGFMKCIQRALTRGWNVELVSWKKSMSRLWRDKIFRIEWRNAFSVVELDDYLDELVLE
jgi:hypothetical protein